jgi:hypothetical protein
MPIRTFKQYVIATGGTPQPLIGTLLNGAVTASPVAQSVLVDDSSMFRVGDRAMIGRTTSGQELVDITAIANSTHITAIFTQAHADNSNVALLLECSAFFIQVSGDNSGNIYLGTDGLVKTGDVHVILEIGGSITMFSSANIFGANPENVVDYWVDGTTNDVYLPSVTIT